jgi:hypothetical protein
MLLERIADVETAVVADTSPAGPTKPIARPTPGSPPQLKKPGLAPLPEPGLPGVNTSGGRDRSKGESGDNYPGALFSIPGTAWRVSVCREGRQWVLQQRRAKDHWGSRKFFATKRRLAVVLPTVVGTQAAALVKDKIEALPT